MIFLRLSEAFHFLLVVYIICVQMENQTRCAATPSDFNILEEMQLTNAGAVGQNEQIANAENPWFLCDSPLIGSLAMPLRNGETVAAPSVVNCEQAQSVEMGWDCIEPNQRQDTIVLPDINGLFGGSQLGDHAMFGGCGAAMNASFDEHCDASLKPSDVKQRGKSSDDGSDKVRTAMAQTSVYEAVLKAGSSGAKPTVAANYSSALARGANTSACGNMRVARADTHKPKARGEVGKASVVRDSHAGGVGTGSSTLPSGSLKHEECVAQQDVSTQGDSFPVSARSHVKEASAAASDLQCADGKADKVGGAVVCGAKSGGRRGEKRKARTYSQATPSQYCHICSRRPHADQPHFSCGNLLQARCRKTICQKCFDKNKWDAEAVRKAKPGTWLCTHCRDECPPWAQCAIYNRTSDRRRLKLINHRKKKSGCTGIKKKETRCSVGCAQAAAMAVAVLSNGECGMGRALAAAAPDVVSAARADCGDGSARGGAGGSTGCKAGGGKRSTKGGRKEAGVGKASKKARTEERIVLARSKKEFVAQMQRHGGDISEMIRHSGGGEQSSAGGEQPCAGRSRCSTMAVANVGRQRAAGSTRQSARCVAHGTAELERAQVNGARDVGDGGGSAAPRPRPIAALFDEAKVGDGAKRTGGTGDANVDVHINEAISAATLAQHDALNALLETNGADEGGKGMKSLQFFCSQPPATVTNALLAESAEHGDVAVGGEEAGRACKASGSRKDESKSKGGVRQDGTSVNVDQGKTVDLSALGVLDDDQSLDDALQRLLDATSAIDANGAPSAGGNDQKQQVDLCAGGSGSALVVPEACVDTFDIFAVGDREQERLLGPSVVDNRVQLADSDCDVASWSLSVLQGL